MSTERYELAMAKIEGLEKGLTILTLEDEEGSWTPQNHVGLREHNGGVSKLCSSLKAVLELHGSDDLYECPVCIATWENGDYKYGGAKGWVAENFPCPTARTIIEGILG